MGELNPFFEANNDKVTHDMLIKHLDSKCSNRKYNPEVVKTIFDRMSENPDGTIDREDFVEQFLNIEDILKKHHLEILH